jgi:ribosome biogenesis GTPase A
MEERMDYQWYPGHMTKARRMMQENIGLVDLVIELADARIPLSSRNPDIDSLCGGKARILLMTKADMADPVRTAKFQKYFEDKGFMVIAMDARTRKANEKIKAYVEKACAAKRERDKRRGIVGRPLRAMVVGIPNVGKSTFINSFAGKASAKTGNKPGVTRGKQWIRLNKSLELLDTPGILWPKFEDRQVGVNLALTGAIRQELLEEQELSLELLDFLQREYPALLKERYAPEGAEWEFPMDNAKLLGEIALSRNLLKTGGEPDWQRAAKMVLDDFRNGKTGRISLETPPEGGESSE